MSQTDYEQACNSGYHFAEFSSPSRRLYGAGGRLFLDRLDQAVQAGKGQFRLAMQYIRFFGRQITQPSREVDEILSLRQRAPRNIEEMKIVFFALP